MRGGGEVGVDDHRPTARLEGVKEGSGTRQTRDDPHLHWPRGAIRLPGLGSSRGKGRLEVAGKGVAVEVCLVRATVPDPLIRLTCKIIHNGDVFTGTTSCCLIEMLLVQVGSLAANLASGIGVVLANKWVFTTAHFQYPTALTALHYVSNTAIVLVIFRPAPQPEKTDPHRRSIQILTVVWALHNALSNISLNANSVGLYQISKILVTPMIVLIQYVMHSEVPHRLMGCALVGACAGVAIATINDVSFELQGATIAVVSCSCSSVLKVMQQDALQRRGVSSLELMHKTWAAQTFILLLSTPLLDPNVIALLHYHFTTKRIALLALSCLASFALNVSSLSAIKFTNALALVLLGQGKTAMTIVLGWLFFDRQPTPMQCAGSVLAMFSLGVYTYGSLVLPRPKDASSAPITAEHCALGGATGSSIPGSSEDDMLENQPLTRAKA